MTPLKSAGGFVRDGDGYARGLAIYTDDLRLDGHAKPLQMPARPEAIVRILHALPDAGRKSTPGSI